MYQDGAPPQRATKRKKPGDRLCSCVCETLRLKRFELLRGEAPDPEYFRGAYGERTRLKDCSHTRAKDRHFSLVSAENGNERWTARRVMERKVRRECTVRRTQRCTNANSATMPDSTGGSGARGTRRGSVSSAVTRSLNPKWFASGAHRGCSVADACRRGRAVRRRGKRGSARSWGAARMQTAMAGPTAGSTRIGGVRSGYHAARIAAIGHVRICLSVFDAPSTAAPTTCRAPRRSRARSHPSRSPRPAPNVAPCGRCASIRRRARGPRCLIPSTARSTSASPRAVVVSASARFTTARGIPPNNQPLQVSVTTP